ncbi:MAG TPA: ABC transporter permease [Candidatus Limnocylindrales bacterium]|nr:ABC transporter permease [Candidatus Limnocylindrales bacterium]
MGFVSAAVAWFADAANWSGPGGIPQRLLEHVLVSGLAMIIALAIVLPLGLWIGHRRRGAAVAVGLAGLGRAVPTLAAIAIVLPITAAYDPQLGFKLYPVVLAMILLAAPPILVNAYTGIVEVDPDLVEAARGMGMTGPQVLGRVELPLALPVVIGGIRSATVQVIATATLGSIFGFGGLGRFLIDGIANHDTGQIFGGVVLVAALALVAEAGLAGLQRVLAPARGG